LAIQVLDRLEKRCEVETFAYRKIKSVCGFTDKDYEVALEVLGEMYLRVHNQLLEKEIIDQISKISKDTH